MPPAPEPRPEKIPDTQLTWFLQRRGIRDTKVLRAIGLTPRERFLPPGQRHLAWDDVAVDVGCDQTVSQPFIVAAMSIDLALGGTERVLEVGTGVGYQTAILARLAAEVWTVERIAMLSLRARAVLDGLGFINIHFQTGDGTLGWPDAAPFDRIIVTAAAKRVPAALFAQLSEGGWMILPVGNKRSQRLTVVRKQEGAAVVREGLACRFVPLIGRDGWDAPAG